MAPPSPALGMPRGQAGGLIEDIAFERAIEGTEQEVLDREGNVIATRLVHDNRLLKYLLSHLKPERYGTGHAPAAAVPGEAAPPMAPCRISSGSSAGPGPTPS
jgi:hypothetical protein